VGGADFGGVTPDCAYREYLYNMAAKEGAACLHNMLKVVDSASAELIHVNNVKRVVRALEFYKITGGTISAHNEAQKANVSPYDCLFFEAVVPRDEMYRRIDERVDGMIERGLVGEVSDLLDMGYHKGLRAMQGIGYKEVVEYLDGGISLDCAVDKIKRNTRHFAKRQVTWFSHKTDALRLDMQSQPLDTVLSEIRRRFKL
jgi:tRNA dimethylallyltransferase